MFLQYLLSKFEELDDVSKPINYGLDILEKSRTFSSLEDVSYLFDCMRKAQREKVIVVPKPSASRSRSRDPIAQIEAMVPTFKRYVSIYDDDDDFI